MQYNQDSKLRHFSTLVADFIFFKSFIYVSMYTHGHNYWSCISCINAYDTLSFLRMKIAHSLSRF